MLPYEINVLLTFIPDTARYRISGAVFMACTKKRSGSSPLNADFVWSGHTGQASILQERTPVRKHRIYR